MEEPYTEVEFTLPFRVPVEEGTYDGVFAYRGQTLSFSLAVAHQYVYDKRAEQLTGFTAGGSGTVQVFDQFGTSHVSKLTVQLDTLLDDGEEKEAACGALNRLLDVTRFATRDCRVTHVRPQQDVLSFGSKRFEAGGKGKQTFQLGHKSKIVYPAKVRSFSEVHSEIKDMLASGDAVPLWDRYRLEARRHFEERDFAVAVILMNTALELRWAELLKYVLLERGADERAATAQVNQWLARKRTLPTLNAETKNLCGRSLEEDDKALWECLQRARMLRKNVIHPWATVPDVQETFDALAAVEMTISWIHRSLGETVVGG